MDDHPFKTLQPYTKTFLQEFAYRQTGTVKAEKATRQGGKGRKQGANSPPSAKPKTKAMICLGPHGSKQGAHSKQ